MESNASKIKSFKDQLRASVDNTEKEDLTKRKKEMMRNIHAIGKISYFLMKKRCRSNRSSIKFILKKFSATGSVNLNSRVQKEKMF